MYWQTCHLRCVFVGQADLLQPPESVPEELRAWSQRHHDFGRLWEQFKHLNAIQLEFEAQPALAKHVQHMLRLGALLRALAMQQW